MWPNISVVCVGEVVVCNFAIFKSMNGLTYRPFVAADATMGDEGADSEPLNQQSQQYV